MKMRFTILISAALHAAVFALVGLSTWFHRDDHTFDVEIVLAHSDQMVGQAVKRGQTAPANARETARRETPLAQDDGPTATSNREAPPPAAISAAEPAAVPNAAPTAAATEGPYDGHSHGNSDSGGASDGQAGGTDAKMMSAESVYLSEVSRLLESKKSYPMAARRLGHRGRVLVRFVVDRNGTIREAKIVEASQSEILNRAARQLIEGLGGLKPFPSEIHLAEWALVVPIEYQM